MPRFIPIASLLLLAVGTSSAQDSRLVERDGMMYEERTVTVRTPVAETQVVPQQQTVYEPKVVTELRDQAVTKLVPVTTNVWQERWQNPLGVLGPAQKVGEWKPVTRWEQRTEYVRQPFSYRTYVAETRTVQTPVRNMRFVDKQETRSFLVGPAAAFQQIANQTPNYAPASAPRMPNIPRFDDDKLRYGMKPTDASVWR